MEKRMDKKALIFILSGLSVSFAVLLIRTLFELVAGLADLASGAGFNSEFALSKLLITAIGGPILIFYFSFQILIGLLFYLYFLKKIIKNHNSEGKQTYIIVLCAICIIFFTINLFLFIDGLYFPYLIHSICNALSVTGCIIQIMKKGEPPMREEDELLPPKDDIVFPGH